MAPSTRSKRTLAEADPNADMGARAKRATKEIASEKKAPPKGKTTTKKDAKPKTAAKGASEDKENECCDSCAGCGKGLAADEGAVVNDKGNLEAVIKTGKGKKGADKDVEDADMNAGGKKGGSASEPTAKGKAKGKGSAEPTAKRGNKAAAQPTDGDQEADSGTQNKAAEESGRAKTNTVRGLHLETVILANTQLGSQENYHQSFRFEEDFGESPANLLIHPADHLRRRKAPPNPTKPLLNLQRRLRARRPMSGSLFAGPNLISRRKTKRMTKMTKTER